jgi:site-specific recombinase
VLLPKGTDLAWLQALGTERWAALFRAFSAVLSEEQAACLRRHLRSESLYALEMLAIWVAAEELDRDLMRLEPALVERDSAFVALQREIAQCVTEQMLALHEPSSPPFDLAHVEVLLSQCSEQIVRIRRRMVSRGSSIGLTHLLERLEQTLARLHQLLAILVHPHQQDTARQGVELFMELVQAGHERQGIGPLWQRNTRLLARRITENTSDHSGHYITRDRSGYLALLRSAGGAGIVIATLALIKIHIGDLGLPPLTSVLLASLNYGLGFVLVHLCTSPLPPNSRP